VSRAITRSRTPRLLLGAGLLVVVVLVLAQLVLPGIAADRIRSRVAKYGTVLSASVSAFPAVELLWGHADSASVKAGTLHTTPHQTVKLLHDARNINTLTLDVNSVKQGPLQLHNVTLVKHGDAVVASASLAQAVVHTTLAGGLDLQPTTDGSGQLQVRVTGGLFGITASITANVIAQDGALVVQPAGGLLSLARITLFSDPLVSLQSLTAAVDPRNSSSYRLTLTGQLL
jgi:hypothetical protein